MIKLIEFDYENINSKKSCVDIFIDFRKAYEDFIDSYRFQKGFFVNIFIDFRKAFFDKVGTLWNPGDCAEVAAYILSCYIESSVLE